MKVLVTGGAGFIGSHLVCALTESGHSVTVLDDFSSGLEQNLPAKGIRVVRGDLRDADVLSEAVAGVEAVLHHAAVVSVHESIADPIRSAEVNVLGTALLLQQCQRVGVARLIFASSSAVYGDCGPEAISETTLPAPLSPYGAHKLTGEHLCRIASATGGPDTVSLRYFNVYGPRQREDSDYAAVIPRFRQRARAGEAPIIYGDGTQTRDFVHVSDIVQTNLRALEREEPWKGTVVNVARGVATSIKDLALLIAEQEGSQESPIFEPLREGDILHSVANVEQLREALGWTPSVSLLDGLGQCCESLP